MRDRILIAIPSLAGMLPVPLVHFLTKCVELNSDQDCPWLFDLAMLPEKWPHHYARNLAVKALFSSQADKLWFIDDDMIPNATAYKMLAHDADIVSGRYMILKMTKERTAYEPAPILMVEAPDGSGFLNDYPKSVDDMVHEVDAAGGGCLLIKRHVLEDRRMWLETKYTDLYGKVVDYMDEKDHENWAPPIFRHLWKPGGDQLRSEDIDFCVRAKQNGYKIIGDHSSAWGHLKRADADIIAVTIARAMQVGKALAEGRTDASAA